MVLTNLGVAVGNNVQYKRRLKDWNCTKRGKSKISKSAEMWLNTIGATTSYEDVVITSFPRWYGKAAWPFFFTRLPAGSHIPFPYFTYLSLSLAFFPSCLAKFILNSLLSLRGRNYSKTILACFTYKFRRLQTQPSNSPLLAK